MNQKIIPVMLGTDLNCYNLARAFHEQYGVKSYAFGKYAISATKYSRLVHFQPVKDLDQPQVCIRTLKEFAARQEPGALLILFGCTDEYAMLAAQCRQELPEYRIPYPDAALQPELSLKLRFYELCDRYGIPHPATFVAEGPLQEQDLTPEKLGFDYPIIIKPSSSAEYWHHPFPGMKKVYLAQTAQEAQKILQDIYNSGNRDNMVIQEFIGGGDSQMRVFTAFSDEKGKVRAMCLGHTMIEEHTPKGLGNHAAIITEPVSQFPLAGKLQAMLEDLGYTGYSNFDIKLRPGTTDDFRVFEINLRQGRSNFYVTASGINLARLAVETYADPGDSLETAEQAFFWHHVPKSVAYRYTEDKSLVQQAKALAKQGKERSSVWYPKDMCMNPLRTACVLELLRRQFGKFSRYYPKPGQE